MRNLTQFSDVTESVAIRASLRCNIPREPSNMEDNRLIFAIGRSDLKDGEKVERRRREASGLWQKGQRGQRQETTASV